MQFSVSFLYSLAYHFTSGLQPRTRLSVQIARSGRLDDQMGKLVRMIPHHPPPADQIAVPVIDDLGLHGSPAEQHAQHTRERLGIAGISTPWQDARNPWADLAVRRLQPSPLTRSAREDERGLDRTSDMVYIPYLGARVIFATLGFGTIGDCWRPHGHPPHP